MQQLTERQLRVARMIGEGLTNKEIAGKLSMSESTVKQTIIHLRMKLGVSRKRHIPEICRKLGLF